jgi:hypothetical protein
MRGHIAPLPRLTIDEMRDDGVVSAGGKDVLHQLHQGFFCGGGNGSGGAGLGMSGAPEQRRR